VSQYPQVAPADVSVTWNGETTFVREGTVADIPPGSKLEAAYGAPSNLAPTRVAVYVVLDHEGTLGVVKAAEGITALYGLIRLGRWWRDVKPPEPKARRAKD
jgi:hypothetical protein